MRLIIVVVSLILNAATFSEAKEKIIYKYQDKNGVISFTDQFESIPKSLRHSVETIRRDDLPEIESPAPKKIFQNIPAVKTIQDFISNQWKNPIVIGLLIIIAILLLWCIKLWIKNIILKFMARIAIKVAIGVLIYIAGHYLYREFSPIKKAEENIERFQEKEVEKNQTLEEIN